MKNILSLLISFTVIVSYAQPSNNLSASEIQHKLEKLKYTGNVLYIAAHPDDENTRLLSYLASEMKMRTAYLSLTRGDGGQNLIGTEQSEKLGMIRTQELLAARRIDGAEQFFTRAFDFGFSKNPEETLNFWNKDSVLADMVWVIRKFQPDIIITRFPTDGSGGHGHHTASAILAEDAFDAAADPKMFPEQLKFYPVWKTKRLVWNGFNFSGRPQSDGADFSKIDVGSYNSLLGKSYGEIASHSRSQHKSQGFGVPMQRGSITETFRYVKGDSIKNNIFEGINNTWSRFSEAKKTDALISKIIKEYKPTNPSLIIPSLIQLNKELEKISSDIKRIQKQKDVKELIIACAGLFCEVNGKDFMASPGSQENITINAINRSSVKVELLNVKIGQTFDTSLNKELLNNQQYSYSSKLNISKDQKFSAPYWLIQKPSKGIFHVSNQNDIGKPFNDANIPAIFTFKIAGEIISIEKNLTYKWTDPVKGELYRDVEVLPNVMIKAEQKNVIFSSATSSKKISLKVRPLIEKSSGTVMLEMPAGWESNPKQFTFQDAVSNTDLHFEFDIKPGVNSVNGNIYPYVLIDGIRYNHHVDRIEYDHIPVQTNVQSTSIRIEKLNLITKGRKAGYIPGAGDEIPDALKELGYEVIMLNDDVLSQRSLNDLDVIITGIRVYNTNENMKSNYDKLMNYVKDGGNLVVQYNTNNFISSIVSKVGPYPFQVNRDRVTDENAEMKFVDPTDPLLNYPNKITNEDFKNWVQERGLYFVTNIDPNYRKVFICNDPGEKENEGILITTKYGKGVFTYTGISFFRQLPAGVPGAYRLFANIISQTK